MIGLGVRAALLAVPVMAIVAATSAPTFAASLYSQGFETNTTDWATVDRVPSGANGIASASGGFHAQAGAGDFTRWGGYHQTDTTPGPLPGSFQPYTTSIDIFLNVAGGAGNDTRFDFSSAISTPAGGFLRDFVFSGGFYTSADLTGPGAGTDRFVVSASNNTPGWPQNPARDPFAITNTGWYTFQHAFTDNAGTLNVTMSIYDAADILVHSWLLGGDAIGTAGGNRYGWFVNNGFPFLAIDNASLSTPDAVPVPAALPLFMGGLGVMGLLGWRRKRKAAAAAA